MSTLGAVFREFFALFVDDGSLALATLAVVALTAVLAAIAPGYPLAAGAVLLIGCLCVLVANVRYNSGRV
jgi:hypothetical protein